MGERNVEEVIAARDEPGSPSALADVCVVLPTYNEALTILEVLGRLRAVMPGATFLVVDDGSPDGTAALVEGSDIAGPITVLRRPRKMGLGSAYRAGLAWAAEQGHAIAVAMDSDLSHEPETAPLLVATLERDHVQLVIGSRYVAGGGTVDWPWHRRALSRNANRYARLALRTPVRDATAGFRAYRISALEQVGIQTLESEGYAFQLETVHQIVQAFGPSAVGEVPITFHERVAGQSKMSWRVASEAMVLVTRWGWHARRQPHPRAPALPRTRSGLPTSSSARGPQP